MKAGEYITERYLAKFEDIWDKSLLVFDTSSMLRIYEWQLNKAIEFKDVLKFKVDNIWIPHQFNLEFRKHVGLVEAENKYVKIIERIENQPIKWAKVRKMPERWESNGFEEAFKLKVLEMDQADEFQVFTSDFRSAFLYSFPRSPQSSSIPFSCLFPSDFRKQGKGDRKPQYPPCLPSLPSLPSYKPLPQKRFCRFHAVPLARFFPQFLSRPDVMIAILQRLFPGVFSVFFSAFSL